MEDLTAHLPDELLLKIFAFAGAVSLPSFRCVCARWWRLGGDEMLWARAQITQQTAKSDFEISRALRAAPALGALLLDDPYRAPAPEVFAAALLTPRLEALQISTIEGVDAISALRLLNRHASELRDLHLRADKRLAALGILGESGDPTCSCGTALLRAEGLLPLLQVIATMAKLKNLTLYGDFEYGYPGGVDSGWDSLESLDIRQGILRYDAPRSYLMSILRSTRARLRRLQLPRCAQLSPAILSAVSDCSRLEDLAPSRVNDLALLADSLTSSLRSLRVQCDLLTPIAPLPPTLRVSDGNTDTPKGILSYESEESKHFFLQNVRKLVLRIGDADNAVAVAHACSGTEYLDLRGSISPWAIKIVSELPNLSKLKICEPPVRLRLGTGDPMKIRLRMLVDVLKVRPLLRLLDLRFSFQGRSIPEQADRLIRAAVPNALILPPVKNKDCQDEEGSDEDIGETDPLQARPLK